MKKKSSPFQLGVLLISYFILVLLLFNVFCLFNLNKYLLVIEFISIIVPIIIYIGKTPTKEKIKITCIYLLILIIFPFVYSTIFDTSCDGNTYHKTAIGYIKNGWNPIYETSKEFYTRNTTVPVINDKTALWIEHYPNGNWIISAIMYEMTGSIESGKCSLLIFSIILFLFMYDYLRKKLNKKVSMFISFLSCYSPIVISQIFTYYIDGLLGICLGIQLLLLLQISKKSEKIYWWCLAGTIYFASGIKFSGFAFSGIFSCVFYFKEFYKVTKNKEYKKFLQITKNFIIIYLTAILLIGSSSYVKNFVEHGHPFYPLQGKNSVDIITTMQPKSFINKSATQKNIISLFSKTDNILYDSGLKPELKLPFLVYRHEINMLVEPDNRISGMGPLFTYSLILTFIILIWTMSILYKKDKQKFIIVFYSLFTIMLSILLLEERWWARYVPQAYFIPIIALISLCLINNFVKRKRTLKILFILLSSAIFVNSSGYWYHRINELNKFNLQRSDLIELSQLDKVRLKLAYEEYYGVYFNLKDYKINYEIVEEIPNEKRKYKYGSRVIVEDE